ncbi:hypothetical protein CALVIDRAFT_469807, partial [Calocera viscosa TUFC12733]
RHLASEVTSLMWAMSMQDLVHEEIAKQRSEAGPGDPVHTIIIPKVRFVHSGLFRVTQANPGKDKKKTRSGFTYLVEELIGGTGDGLFIKYLHNSSAVPRVLSGKDANIAAFLSFSQHLQFDKTGGLVYISDYQVGAGGLLTDPQVMTNPYLQGELFGGGNVAAAFEAFASEHTCNEYCVTFGL